jgi:hypothetical protein
MYLIFLRYCQRRALTMAEMFSAKLQAILTRGVTKTISQVHAEALENLLDLDFTSTFQQIKKFFELFK